MPTTVYVNIIIRLAEASKKATLKIKIAKKIK